MEVDIVVPFGLNMVRQELEVYRKHCLLMTVLVMGVQVLRHFRSHQGYTDLRVVLLLLIPFPVVFSLSSLLPMPESVLSPC